MTYCTNEKKIMNIWNALSNDCVTISKFLTIWWYCWLWSVDDDDGDVWYSTVLHYCTWTGKAVYFFCHNVLALYCFIGFRKIVRLYRQDAAKSMPQYFFSHLCNHLQTQFTILLTFCHV